MKISVIIPAYNEEHRISKTLSQTICCLKQQALLHEIVIVDDGSTDKTQEILKMFAEKNPEIKILKNDKNEGKGYSVRRGVLEAAGDIIFFSDADLSTPAEEIGRFVGILSGSKADILIGSRSVKGSVIKVRQPFYRQGMGKVFNLFVRLLTPLRFHDTQCGFKAFRRDAAKKIFSESKHSGFVFDVELLLLARKYGFEAQEVPVTWVNSLQSKVGLLKDSVGMFVDLLKLGREFKNL